MTYRILTIFCTLTFFFLNALAANETEPNNAKATANALPQDTIMNGASSSGDDDYFVGVPSSEGTVKIYTNFTATNGGNDFYLYVYAKNLGQIGSKTVINTLASTDTLTIPCVGQDTIYIRVLTSYPCNYNVRFGVDSIGIPDVAANETSGTATYFDPSDSVQGRIGYSTTITDANDWFKSKQPTDGLLRIYIERINTSDNAGADFYFTTYANNLSNIGSIAKINESPGVTLYDTLDIYCRASDSVLFRIQSSYCYSYKFRYVVIDNGVTDPQTNETAATSIYFNQTDSVQGRIGYTTTTTDADDWYKSEQPSDGLLRIYIERINTSNNGGADFYFTTYAKNLSNIGSIAKINEAYGVTLYDTLDIYCRASDTVLFRVQSSYCYTYKFRYEVIDNGITDAPNESAATATYFGPSDSVQGRIGYTTTVTDNDDWYKSEQPSDGLLRVYIERINTSLNAGADFYFTTYAKNLSNIGSIAKVNEAYGITLYDTLDIYCRASDTVFFRVQSSYCYTYKFRYEVIDNAVTDSPNETAGTAIYFNPTDSVQGRIGYTTTVTDNDDWYKSNQPIDGQVRVYIERINTSNNGGADFYFTSYAKNLSNIGSISRINEPPGVTLYDTLDIYCRASDTLFFRVQSSYCYTYKFRYEIISTLPSDTGSNNTLQTATHIPLDIPITGKIGYSDVTTDANDYFLMDLPTESKLTFYLNYNNTSNSTGADFYAYIYRKNGSLVSTLSRVNQALGPHVDTLIYPCAPADSVYLRIFSSGCFEYSFTPVAQNNAPLTKIISARTGNEVGFAPKVSNVDTFYWDFGNGQTTGRKYPKQNFGIGNHTVKLVGTNATCNKTYTDSVMIEVKGVESFTPNRSGTGGDLLMTIYGGGLDSATKVTLRNGGTVYQTINVVTNNKKNALVANFDLHQAAAGVYDVEVEIQGLSPVIFTNGFTIEKLRYPYCKAEVNGPNRWRINRNTNFEIKITNQGNVNANGVVIGFAYPKNVDVTLIPKLAKLDRTKDFEAEADGETFIKLAGEYAAHYDSAAQAYPIDSLDGKAFDGMLYLLTLAKVPANSTITLPFTANTKSSGNPEFYVYSYHPNRYGSKGTEHWSNTTNQIMEQGIDGLDMYAGESKNKFFQAFTKSLKIGQKHLALAGATAGAYFDAKVNGYEVTAEMHGILNAELDEANAFATKTFVKELGTAAVQKGLGKAINTQYARNSALNKKLANPKLGIKEWKTLNNEFLKSNEALNKILKLDDIFTNAKNLESLYDKLKTLKTALDGCPELEPQLEELLKKVEEQLEHQDPDRRKTQSVTSMDPNEIYGPEGIDIPRYRKDLDVMHYFITCENIDTAQAAAQEVIIIDTLNPSVFDVSTLTFGHVNIGNKSMRMLFNRNEFYGELSLYPEMPIVVRVMATVDTVSGEVRWTMAGIDTNTNDLPIDPNLGILPPNTNPPFGEASVSYSVKLKPNLTNGTVINNRANIIFDENEPILTNTWSNTIDIVAPSSQILSTEVREDTVIIIKLSGQDTESGVAKYKLYVQRDSTEWVSTGNVFVDSTTFIGGYDQTYNFYVESADRVGNEEIKTPASEAEVYIKPKEIFTYTFEGDFVIFPNPTSGNVQIVAKEITPNCVVSCYDIFGRRITQLELELSPTPTNFNMASFHKGIYIFKIKAGSQEETFKVSRL